MVKNLHEFVGWCVIVGTPIVSFFIYQRYF